MKNSILLVCFFIIILFANKIYSQCSSVYISTQTEMNAFNCTKVNSLTIQNNDEADPITNFSNLQVLDTVTSSFSITNFNYGNGFIKFDSLKIISNIYLTNIATLDSIIFPSLKSINNLRFTNITSVEKIVFDTVTINSSYIFGSSHSQFNIVGKIIPSHFEISDNNLSSLNFLLDISSINNLYLKNCPNINSINYFSGLKRCGYLGIDNCPITDFSPLSTLIEIAGFDFKNLSSLTNLDFFSNVKYVSKSCFLSNNNNLTDVTGLNNIKHIYSLDITENDQLNNCCILEKMLTSTSHYSMKIRNNGTGCESIADVLISCTDQDNDNVLNDDDNCPNISNPNQADDDNDGIGNACDAYPTGNDPILEVDNASLFINNLNAGIIMKDKNGQCFKLKVNEKGGLFTQVVNCP